MALRDTQGRYIKGNKDVGKAASKPRRMSPKELIKELEAHGVYVITELVTLIQDPDLTLELRAKILLELIQYGWTKLRSVEITDKRDSAEGIEIIEQLKLLNEQLAKNDVANGR